MTNESLRPPADSDPLQRDSVESVAGAGSLGSARNGAVERQEQLERTLRERERELKEAYRIAKLGTWHWTVKDDSVTWSDEVYRAFGFDPALPPPSFERLAPLHRPESWARLAAAVTRTLETGEGYELDVEIVLPDGSTKWLTACGEVESRADGKPSALRGTIQEITERKLAEQQLGHANATLGNVLKSITDGLCVLDRDWRYTYFSEQGARMIGLSREELLGACCWDLFPQARETKFYSECLRAKETGEPTHFEDYLAEPINRWFEAHCYPSATGISLYFRDVTDRKLAEQAREKSEARFRRLYESNLIGIGFPDRFGGIQDGNDELLRIVGYSREDLTAGRVRWDIMTPPEYRELDLMRVAEAAERGSCTPYEKEYIRKDGARVPILCGFARLERSDPDTESIGFILDFSAQKQAEAALRESEQQFRALAESLPQLVWVTDAAGGNIYCNRRMLDYTGLPYENLMGTSYLVPAFHPEDMQPSVDKWLHCIRTGEPYQNEYRLRRHDGVYRHFLARGLPLRNDAGQIERWIGSSTDIHEQKLAEHALRRAEKLDAAARFAASVAHEINNPLASVTNTLYLALQDPDLHEKTREYLSLADRELARAAQVVTRTLRFHRQTTSAGMANLCEIMDSAYSLFASRFKACGIVVEREYLSEEKLYCFGDELRQVFTNLLSNALDATAHGGVVRIRVHSGRCWNESSERGLRVVVADTGHGIPAPLRKQIFEPFVSTKSDTGTGLGLWVSDGIVHKHKGRITMRSRVGEAGHGTVFSLFFPF